MTAGRVFIRGQAIRISCPREAIDAGIAYLPEERAGNAILRPLKGAAHARIRTFSGGNQQKVVIARWLLGAADIFLFDEPTQGIDVGAREQVYEVIRELAAEGAGIIIVSSEAEEVARLCSKVHFMRDGAIVQTLSGVEVTEAAVSRAIIEGEVEVDASDELRFRGPDADDFSRSGDVK